jgi:hypothetical protein
VTPQKTMNSAFPGLQLRAALSGNRRCIQPDDLVALIMMSEDHHAVAERLLAAAIRSSIVV